MKICDRLVSRLHIFVSCAFWGCLLFFLPLTASDALSYGLQLQNGEYIRKALEEKSQKELVLLFSEKEGEKIAQAYIDEAFRQPIALARMEGFIGALHAPNSSSALALEKALDDPHEVIRSLARRASIAFFDSFIQQKLSFLARLKKGEERREAFASLAAQNTSLALRTADEIFQDPNTPLLEKVTIYEILSSYIFDSDPELHQFLEENILTEDTRLWLGSLQPNRIDGKEVLAGLKSRSFVCQLGALECIGLWKSHLEQEMEEIRPLLADMLISSNSRIKAKAAWACFCQIPTLREESLSSLKLLSQIGDKEAELVSEVLCRSGMNGLELSIAFMKDPYAHPLCRLNAALTLIRYRSQLDKAPFELLTLLKKMNRPLQWNEHAPGQPVLFQTEEEEELGRQFVLFRDIEVRSYLLGLILNNSSSPQIEKEAYFFAETLLKKKSWGPLLEGGSQLFLQVGPESIAFARKLAMSFYEEVRIQTAGILAALGCSKEALDIIQMSFPSASFDGKMAILTLLPQFPLQDVLPFLISAMKDKSSLLRTRAASVFLFMKYRY